LAEVLRLSAQLDLRPIGLQSVSTYGEMVQPGLADLCDEVWGAKLIDGYSCEEIGPLAQQCPHGSYHVHAERVLLEVLDDDDNPCQVGGTGRVVVSSLHSFSRPVLGMEMGDLGAVGGACACGRGLPVLERIEGRVRARAHPAGWGQGVTDL